MAITDAKPVMLLTFSSSAYSSKSSLVLLDIPIAPDIVFNSAFSGLAVLLIHGLKYTGAIWYSSNASLIYFRNRVLPVPHVPIMATPTAESLLTFSIRYLTNSSASSLKCSKSSESYPHPQTASYSFLHSFPLSQLKLFCGKYTIYI